jgi:hypothetical protein
VILHVLDDVAADYPGAVRDGAVVDRGYPNLHGLPLQGALVVLIAAGFAWRGAPAPATPDAFRPAG